MSVGKVLVRYSGLDERLARRWRKKQEQKGAVERPEFESVEKPSDACGSSRREKNRVTFFCRQHITGVFDPDANIEGHIGCSVLLVPATKPVRLEGYEYALKSVDCVASEHSKHMDEKSFLNQVLHTIGPRQTGDCLCKGSRVSFNIGPKPLPSPPPLNVMSQGLL
jgi:hypothetical protein